jgi:imidazolonepropionase-like amidohydrolase
MHLKVAAHAHGARGIEAAANAGVDSIEHGTLADAAAIQAMKAHGTWFVPTLMAFTGVEERLGKGIYTPNMEEKGRSLMALVGKALNAAYEAGVPIALGTDAAVYAHGRNGEEAARMVEQGGMAPRDVLIAATSGAARLLGLENEVGRIAPGYSADLIAVDGDPVQNIRVLEDVDWVMARGHVID